MKKIKKKFPNITIAGNTRKVYSLDLSGGGTNVTSIRVSFLTEPSDNFQLSSKDSKTISIDSFYTFTGFITSISKRTGLSGEITELTFVDESIVLDKYYVGLKGKHGGTAVFKNATPVSSTFNIDSIQLNNVTTFTPSRPPSPTVPVSIFKQDGTTPAQLILVGSAIDPCADLQDGAIDVCDPCSTAIPQYQQQTNECLKNRSFRILDVDYTFNDLITASESIVDFVGAPIVPITYRAQHIGTLREVLNTWCQELGYSFYFHDNKVHFFNIQNGITLKPDLDSFFQDCIIEDKTETESIDQNVNQINIAYFGKDGEIKDYDCDSNDLPGSSNGTALQQLSLKPISLDLVLKSASIVNLYKNNEKFKQCLMAGAYSKDFRDFLCWRKILEFDSGPDSKMVGDQPLMGWKVKAVCFENMNESHVSNGYSLSAMSIIYNHVMNELIPENQRQELKNQGAYLVLAETYEIKDYDFEQTIMKNFCGKYWWASWPSKKQQLTAIDGQLTILPKDNQNISNVFPDLSLDHPYLVSIKADLQSTVDGDKQIVLLERNGSIYPTAEDPVVKSFLKALEKFKVTEIDFACEYASLKKEDKLFLIPASNSIKIDVSVDKERHPVDNKTGDESGFNSHSAEYVKFELELTKGKKESFKAYFPRAGSYSVTREPSGNTVSFSYKSLIPKLESIIIKNNPPEDFLSTSLNYIPFTNNNLGNLRPVGSSACKIDEATVIQYGKSILNNFTQSTMEKTKTISYSLFGIPAITSWFTAKDGLISFSIKMDSSGTRTSVSFSSRPPSPKSLELKKNEIKYLLAKQSIGNFINTLR